jgi:hypothetical protein
MQARTKYSVVKRKHNQKKSPANGHIKLGDKNGSIDSS